MKLLAVTFFTCWNLLLAFKYEIHMRDENFYKPCEDFPDNFLEKYVKLPENVTILPDDTLHVEGDLEILFDVDPSKNYQFQFEIYKRVRGEWQKTIYTIKRADFCTSIFDPADLWHTYTKEVQGEQRKCPMKKGRIWSVNVTTEQEFEMASPSLEGEYLSRFEMGYKGTDEFICVEIFCTVFRV